MGEHSDFWLAYERSISAHYQRLNVERHRVDVEGLADRFGAEAFRRRIALQEAYVERLLGKGRGLLRFGPLLENWNLLPVALRCMGIYRRGLQNAMDVCVEQHEVCLPEKARGLKGMRILQVSDLHLDAWAKVPEGLIAAVSDVSYDFCVLTGDYRYLTYGPHEPCMDLLASFVDAITAPVFGILGNHDAAEMVPDCERMGIRMLVNEGTYVSFGDDRFFLGGVDDSHYYQASDFDRAFSAREQSCDYSILLAHSTEEYACAPPHDVDLMLSGHTHGGQICLPGAFAPLNNARSPRWMIDGAWSYNGMQGYTSRGAGCVSTPVRFNCPPEITLHNFV